MAARGGGSIVNTASVAGLQAGYGPFAYSVAKGAVVHLSRVSAAALAFSAWAIIIRLFTERAVPGWASTVVPMFFLGGVQLLALGVIGGYLSRVYAEAKQRPRFIVEKAL